MSQTSDYPPPFDREDADVVLRPSDGIHFRCFKTVLSLVSHVFRDMFLIPQPGQQIATGKISLPVVDVSENSTALDILLRYCHPLTPHVQPSTFESAVDLMEAGRKYNIQTIFDEGWKSVVRLVGETEPLRAYGVAWKFGLHKEARQAAKLLLNHPSPIGFHPDLNLMPLVHYVNLVNYHTSCGIAASNIARDLDNRDYSWIDPYYVVWSHKQVTRSGIFAQSPSSSTTPARHNVHSFEQWWKIYMNQVADKLVQLPNSGVITSPDFQDAAMRALYKCDNCSLYPFGKLAKDSAWLLWNRFLKSFEEEVEKAIDKVTLQVDF